MYMYIVCQCMLTCMYNSYNNNTSEIEKHAHLLTFALEGEPSHCI